MPASDPLWTDYVAAFGAIVSIVIALVALIMAMQSAAEARRSSEAAKRTAETAEKTRQLSEAVLDTAGEQLSVVKQEHDRLEAERDRRPAVERIELSDVESRPGAEAPPGIFRVGFKNEGDRELDDAVLSILLGPGCHPVATDRWGNPRPEAPRDETLERWPAVDGDPRAFDYLAIRCSVPAGESRIQYVCLTRRGRYPLRVKLFSASLERGGPWVDALVDVDERGLTTVGRPDGAETRSFEGRCADFDLAA